MHMTSGVLRQVPGLVGLAVPSSQEIMKDARRLHNGIDCLHFCDYWLSEDTPLAHKNAECIFYNSSGSTQAVVVDKPPLAVSACALAWIGAQDMVAKLERLVCYEYMTQISVLSGQVETPRK